MSEACPAKLQEAPVSRAMTQADIAGCDAQFAWMCWMPSASTCSAKYTLLGKTARLRASARGLPTDPAIRLASAPK